MFLAEGNMQLLVSLFFVLLSGFHQDTKQRGHSRSLGDRRPPGQQACIQKANTLQIPQMPHHCSCLIISIYPCVRAIPSILMSSQPLNRQLPVYLFCISRQEKHLTPEVLCIGIEVIQLGALRRSQTWGQD